MLKLAARFQSVRIAANDYRLVSLTDSVRVKLREGSNGLLDLVVPLLVTGESVQGILKRVGNSHRVAVRDLLHDLTDRGVIEDVAAEQILLSERETEVYAEQMRFLSHFHPLSGTGPSPNQTRRITAQDMQRMVRDATVMLVGLGRTGARLAQDLAALGVGKLIGYDAGPVTRPDVVTATYKPEHLGMEREKALQSQLEQRDGLVSFRAAGIGSETDLNSALQSGIDLLLLCEDVFNPERYRAINRLCLRRKVKWNSVRSLGFRVELGPTVVPFDTPCFHCYELRRLGNQIGDHDQWEGQSDVPRDGALPPPGLNVTVGDQLLSIEVLKLLTGFSTPLTYGRILVIDLLTFEMKAHPVLRVPRCAECGRQARGRPSVNTWLFDETHDDVGH